MSEEAAAPYDRNHFMLGIRRIISTAVAKGQGPQFVQKVESISQSGAENRLQEFRDKLDEAFQGLLDIEVKQFRAHLEDKKHNFDDNSIANEIYKIYKNMAGG